MVTLAYMYGDRCLHVMVTLAYMCLYGDTNLHDVTMVTHLHIMSPYAKITQGDTDG